MRQSPIKRPCEKSGRSSDGTDVPICGAEVTCMVVVHDKTGESETMCINQYHCEMEGEWIGMEDGMNLDGIGIWNDP